MAANTTKDMTVGSPMKLIINFSIPLLFGLLFQQFYSVVDTVIVGKFLGVKALAGVGATGSINFMIVGFCIGLCSGFAIPVSHKFGAKDYSGMRQIIANSVWVSVFFATVITLVVSLLCRKILTWMNTPADIFAYSYQYILIIFLGIPAIFLYNMLSGIIRSIGDSKTPLMFLILSSLLNVVLDLLFILVVHTGIAGAAIATVISQLISGILCLFYMTKKFEILHITKEEWRINPQHIKVLCGMGIPMGLQYSITAIGSVILQTAVNGLGSVAVASVTASNKVHSFFCCPLDALGSTMATYAGQNIGAKRLDRINKGLWSSYILGFAYSIGAFVFLFFTGNFFLSLFIDAGETVVKSNAYTMLLYTSGFYLCLTIVNVTRFMIQGMGFSTLAIFSGVFEMIARTIGGLILIPTLGLYGAFLSSPLAWVLADLFLIPAFLYSKKKCQKILSI